jgi:uncharacterized protein YfdQ (DUF2303 family)
MPNDITAELDSVPSAVEQIADLARREAERTPDRYLLNADSALVVTKVRTDERVDVLDLERHLVEPQRTRGTVTVHDPGDFINVVNRLSNVDHTTVWANVDNGTITAVVNDHATWDQPGWRDHTIQLQLQADEDWQAWMALNGKLVDQARFAEFIEDVAHTVVEPDNATMLEVASTMVAKREVEFSQSHRLQTGDVQLRFEETTKANAGVKGDMEIPEQILVQLSPWRGVEPARIDGRLRFSIRGGQLAIGYKLIRPDAFRDEVFAGLVETVRSGLDTVPIYRGTPPQPVR